MHSAGAAGACAAAWQGRFRADMEVAHAKLATPSTLAPMVHIQ